MVSKPKLRKNDVDRPACVVSATQGKMHVEPTNKAMDGSYLLSQTGQFRFQSSEKRARGPGSLDVNDGVDAPARISSTQVVVPT